MQGYFRHTPLTNAMVYYTGLALFCSILLSSRRLVRCFTFTEPDLFDNNVPFDNTTSIYISVGRYHGNTVEPQYFFFTVLVPSRSWYYRGTAIYTVALPYGTCQQIVISAKIFVLKTSLITGK